MVSRHSGSPYVLHPVCQTFPQTLPLKQTHGAGHDWRWPFRGRSSNSSSFNASLLQMIDGLVFLVLFRQVVQMLCSNYVQVQCCFTSTGTGRTIRDREPRTSISTFTQLLSSEQLCSMLLYVHRGHKDCSGRGAQHGHLDFYQLELWGNYVSALLYVHGNH